MFIFKALFEGEINIAFTILFALGIVYCVICFYQFNKVLRGLGDVIQKLDGFDAQHIVNQFENLKAALIDSSLREEWIQYEKSLLHDDDEDNPQVYMTQDPRDYFNSGDLLQHIEAGTLVSLSVFKNMAGVFTGLGILGTFLGLTNGLGSLDLSTIEHMQAGIAGLLKGTVTAFSTSVCGLTLALFFNFFYGHCSRKLNRYTGSIIDKMYEFFPQKSIAEFLLEQGRQTQEQTDQIRDMNDQFVGRLEEGLIKLGNAIDASLAKNLTDSVTNNLSPIVQNLKTSIDSLGNSASTSLSSSISDHMGSQLDQVANTIGHMNEQIRDTLASSERATQENNARLQTSIEMLMNKMNEAMDENIRKQSDSMSASSEAVKELIAEMNENIKEAVSHMVAANQEAHQALIKTTEATKGTIQEITQNVAKGAQAQQQEMSEAAASMKDSVLNVLQSLQEDMKQRDASTKLYLAELKQLIANNQTVVTEAGAAADKFTKASEPMQRVADHMGTQMTQLITANDRFNQNVSNAIRLLHETSVQNNGEADKIKNALALTKESWDSYEKQFKEVSGEMAKTFEILDKGIQQYNKAVSDSLTMTLDRFDHSIDAAMGHISDINEELSDALREFNASRRK